VASASSGQRPHLTAADLARAATRTPRKVDGPNLQALPEADRAAVGRALSSDPERRFASCREFVRALRGPEPGVRGQETVRIALP
jgi:hypothetical protein